MKHSLRLAVFLTLSTGIVSNSYASQMLEKYNVGGYLNIGTATAFTLPKSESPSHLKTEVSNSTVTDFATAYLNKFPATTGLIFIDHGKIIYEKYQGLGADTSEFFSMSIGKSLTSLTVGKALCAGHIKSLDDPALKYVPELSNSNLGVSTIKQLLTMSSGAYQSARGGQPKFKNGIGTNPRSGEPYTGASWPLRLGQATVDDILWGKWWDDVVGKDIARPGEAFIYKSHDTLSLTKVVQRTTGMSSAAYFNQEIWQHIGAEKDAHWESDIQGSTVGSSGFQASLRDWAKLGVWIIDQIKKEDCFGQYLKAATKTQMPLTKSQSSGFDGYGYQWWTSPKHSVGFWGVGFAGQLFGISVANEKLVLKFSYRIDKGSGYELMKFFKSWQSN